MGKRAEGEEVDEEDEEEEEEEETEEAIAIKASRVCHQKGHTMLTLGLLDAILFLLKLVLYTREAGQNGGCGERSAPWSRFCANSRNSMFDVYYVTL
jgi:hypothetical protein